MASLYLSFLGTSNYKPCTYEHQGKRVENVRFVQEATIRLHCEDWSENDQVIIFTTQKAFNCNWQDNWKKDQATGENILEPGLETCIKSINGDFTFEHKDIPDGINESDIWDIFIRVFDSIREKDEIIFDITHGFRSIPMLAVVVLNYAKIMKQAVLKKIYYGALEALGPPAEIQKMDLDDRIVPILDLTTFDQLMEWSIATDRFLISGDATQVSKIANSSARSILAALRGPEKAQEDIKRLAKSLNDFTKVLSTCRGREITRVAGRLRQTLQDCVSHDFKNPINLPLKTILGKIEEQIIPFPGNRIGDGIQAARWCYEHNLIQQSYTILRETLITHFIYKIGEDPNDYKNKNWELAVAAMHQKKEDGQKDSKMIEKFMQFYQTCPDLIKEFINLTDYRNDINHSGERVSYRPAEEFYQKMPVYLEAVEREIKETR